MLRLLFLLLFASTPALAQFPNPPPGPFSGMYNDQSAVVANQSNLVSHASRFNHLMVGEASTKNSSFGSPPLSWMDTLIPNFITGSQIGVTATLGGGAIGAASRSSDTRASGLAASGGSAGGYLVGVNDDTNPSGGPIALGSNSVGIARPSTTNITLGAQQDINSVVSTCAPTPDSPFCSGQASNIAALLTSGAFPSLATQDVTSALTTGAGYGGGPKFKAGIVIGSSSIRAAAGPSILGSNSTVAMAMPFTNYIIWYNGSSASSAVWGGAAGSLNFFTTNTLTVNGVAGVTCSGVNPTTMVVTNGLVTHC